MSGQIVDQLDEKRLKENFSNWSVWIKTKPVRFVGDELNSLLISAQMVLAKAPTTHTWGMQIRERQESGFQSYAFESILFKDKALLAANNSAQRYSDSGTTRLDAQTGLEKYVFAYLGAHDPYYARGNFPAFGVFIKKDAERFPYCNATRRDLHSLEVRADSRPFIDYFLLPEDARKFAAHEAVYLHDGDVFHYLGHLRHFGEKGYIDKRWQWLIEFHFRERVELNYFDAILWPVVRGASSMRSGSRPNARLKEAVAKFAKDNTQCCTITYEITTPSRAPAQFLTAAAVAMNYYLERDRFPTCIEQDGTPKP